MPTKATIKEAVIAVLKKESKPMPIKDIYKKILLWDYYRFRAERPLNVLTTEIRRHSTGIDFPTAHPRKYFQALNNGTYWLNGLSVPNLITNSSLKFEESSSISIDSLKENHTSYVRIFKERILNQLKKIEPKVFEVFSKKLLEVYGFKDLKVTQYSRDGGIDGFGKLKIGITFLSVAFQSKRWKATTVSKKEIQSFRGDIQGKFEQGIYFTTSKYSKEAKEVSIQKGAVPIILLDGNAIIDIMIEKKFGIEVENLPIFVNALDRALTEDL